MRYSDDRLSFFHEVLGSSWDDPDWEWLKGCGLESSGDIFTYTSDRRYGLLVGPKRLLQMFS